MLSVPLVTRADGSSNGQAQPPQLVIGCSTPCGIDGALQALERAK